MTVFARPSLLSFTIKKNDISLIILFLTLVLYDAGRTAFVYPLLLLISAIWIRGFTVKEARLLACFLFVLIIIGLVNVVVIDNYLDLIWKGIYKFLCFVISALAYRKFFLSATHGILSRLRLTIWLSFIASLLIHAGFDLQSMQQMLIINILFMVELYAFIRVDARLLFYLATLILLITTKKQLWFSSLILIFLIHPKILKQYLVLFVGGSLFVMMFGLIGVEKTGITIESRLSGTLTERFITPEPYGNMRLYLLYRLIPDLIEHDIFFGYGLERYGSIAAYASYRDIERGELGLDNFIGKEYNPRSIFGSVAADVGFLTIMMQAGLAGVVLYFFLLWIVARDLKVLVKGFAVICPYFLGGPIVYSVGLPVFLGITYALLALPYASKTNTRERLRSVNVGSRIIARN